MRFKVTKISNLLVLTLVVAACQTTGGGTTTTAGEAATTTEAGVGPTTTEHTTQTEAFEGLPLPEGAEEIPTTISSPEDAGLASFGASWRGGGLETVDFEKYTWVGREYEVNASEPEVVDFYRGHPDTLQEISPPLGGLYFWGRNEEVTRFVFVFIVEGEDPDTTMFLILEGRSDS